MTPAEPPSHSANTGRAAPDASFSPSATSPLADEGSHDHRSLHPRRLLRPAGRSRRRRRTPPGRGPRTAPPRARPPPVAFSDQLADAVAAGARSMVAVHARLRLPSTGIHWRDGVVVTTEATVRRDTDLSVTLPDGRQIPATLAGRDPGTDLAALRIPAGELRSG